MICLCEVGIMYFELQFKESWETLKPWFGACYFTQVIPGWDFRKTWWFQTLSGILKAKLYRVHFQLKSEINPYDTSLVGAGRGCWMEYSIKVSQPQMTKTHCPGRQMWQQTYRKMTGWGKDVCEKRLSFSPIPFSSLHSETSGLIACTDSILTKLLAVIMCLTNFVLLTPHIVSPCFIVGLTVSCAF